MSELEAALERANQLLLEQLGKALTERDIARAEAQTLRAVLHAVVVGEP